MDNELFELCKEVSEKTDWKDTQRDYYDLVYVNPLSGNTSEDSHKVQAITVHERQMYYDKNEHMSAIKICPEYTSDYLLEKLKSVLVNERHQVFYVQLQHIDRDRWRAGYKALRYVHADTPLKSLLKLTLALHEAGEL